MAEGLIALGPDEVQALLAISRRQLTWDPRLRVRLRSTSSALGLYTTPPFNVLALFAVPASITTPEAQQVDVTIDLASLVNSLEVVAANATPLDLSKISEVAVPVTKAMSIAFLPPSDGWQIPISAVSGDVLVSVNEAVAEFNRRAAGQSEAMQQQIAEEIWNRQAWAAIPMRVLHAAHKLGMLPNDASRISASANGTWKRLSTARGHVLVDSATRNDRLSLQLLG